MATVIQVLNKMSELGKTNEISLQFINQHIMEVKRSSKNKPASVKFATDDETVSDFMVFGDQKKKKLGMLLVVDLEDFQEINKMIDEEGK